MKQLILALLPFVLVGQPEFFGYFESEGVISKMGSKTYLYGFNKLRLDIEARPNDNVLIGANINVQKYWGKTKWNVYDFIPGYQNSGFEWNLELPDTILLDNMYVRVNFPLADLTAGRQQISPGVGYAWNPTDIFNTKSLMDPSYEQTGVGVLRAEVPLPGSFALDAVIKPQDDWEHATKQFWLNTGLGRFDLAVTMAKFTWQRVPFESIDYNFGVKIDRLLRGATFVGEIFGLGVWSEYAAYTLDNGLYGYCPVCDVPDLSEMTSAFDEWVVGLDYTFENSLYILGEYFHNGYGSSKKSKLTLNDYFLALEGVTRSLMQDYTFFYIMHPTFDYTSLSAIIFANMNDMSGVVSPMIDWNIHEDTNISAQGGLAWGKDDSEFGLQDWSLTLNITSSF
jgi:hypothetical protein